MSKPRGIPILNMVKRHLISKGFTNECKNELINKNIHLSDKKDREIVVEYIYETSHGELIEQVALMDNFKKETKVFQIDEKVESIKVINSVKNAIDELLK